LSFISEGILKLQGTENCVQGNEDLVFFKTRFIVYQLSVGKQDT